MNSLSPEDESRQNPWTEQEKQTIKIVDLFVNNLQERELASNPHMVVDKIWNWAKPEQSDCIKMICDWILNSNDNSIEEDREKEKVDELVTNLVKKWQTSENSQHLKDIRDKILNHERSGFILRCYQQIIQNRTLNTNEYGDDLHYLSNDLKLLIFKNDRVPEVSNLLYQEVFNLQWLEDTFRDSRPHGYRERFNKWEQSNEGDPRYYSGKEYLIIGPDFYNALQWTKNMKLEEKEQYYITRSNVENQKQKSLN